MGLPKPVLVPLLPLTLQRNSISVDVTGLVDSGAAISVIPYSIGQQLGVKWDQQTVDLQLTGSLAHVPAKGLALEATIAPFPPVTLIFGWAKIDSVPFVLGQMNFFMEFDVCFHRSQSYFEVEPKT